MKKWMICMIVALICVSVAGSAKGVNYALSNQLLRFHVIANSDTPDDQALKLEVRNAVMEQIRSVLPAHADKEETKALIQNHRDLLLTVARKVLSEHGCRDALSLTVEKRYFPKKDYLELSLPAGEYEAVCLEIGQAKGKNWWCVLYPSLGSPAEVIPAVKDALPEETYDLITSKAPEAVFRFKTVDYFMSVKEKLINEWR